MIDINGIAHVQLSVTDFPRSRDFYHWLLHETFGMTIQYDDATTFYCIGGRTGVLIRAADPSKGSNASISGESDCIISVSACAAVKTCTLSMMRW